MIFVVMIARKHDVKTASCKNINYQYVIKASKHENEECRLKDM